MESLVAVPGPEIKPPSAFLFFGFGAGGGVGVLVPRAFHCATISVTVFKTFFALELNATALASAAPIAAD